jgi:hypothetical protein
MKVVTIVLLFIFNTLQLISSVSIKTSTQTKTDAKVLNKNKVRTQMTFSAFSAETDTDTDNDRYSNPTTKLEDIFKAKFVNVKSKMVIIFLKILNRVS